ncbi:hypothetical protein ACS2OW_26395 [Bacillus cereus group sp. BceL035]|uniref:hypothetical protein n=1 Tax=Bacillus cereus group TaxID=86661 RepID=UPI00164A155A|nr:hypothetical protein [Bacillus tropicus]
MSIYNFLATDIELPILKRDSDNIKVFNDFLGLGYKEKEPYRLFGGMLKGVVLDRNEKIFLINGNKKKLIRGKALITNKKHKKINNVRF